MTQIDNIKLIAQFCKQSALFQNLDDLKACVQIYSELEQKVNAMSGNAKILFQKDLQLISRKIEHLIPPKEASIEALRLETQTVLQFMQNQPRTSNSPQRVSEKKEALFNEFSQVFQILFANDPSMLESWTKELDNYIKYLNSTKNPHKLNLVFTHFIDFHFKGKIDQARCLLQADIPLPFKQAIQFAIDTVDKMDSCQYQEDLEALAASLIKQGDAQTALYILASSKNTPERCFNPLKALAIIDPQCFLLHINCNIPQSLYKHLYKVCMRLSDIQDPNTYLYYADTFAKQIQGPDQSETFREMAFVMLERNRIRDAALAANAIEDEKIRNSVWQRLQSHDHNIMPSMDLEILFFEKKQQFLDKSAPSESGYDLSTLLTLYSDMQTAIELMHPDFKKHCQSQLDQLKPLYSQIIGECLPTRKDWVESALTALYKNEKNVAGSHIKIKRTLAKWEIHARYFPFESTETSYLKIWFTELFLKEGPPSQQIISDLEIPASFKECLIEAAKIADEIKKNRKSVDPISYSNYLAEQGDLLSALNVCQHILEPEKQYEQIKLILTQIRDSKLPDMSHKYFHYAWKRADKDIHHALLFFDKASREAFFGWSTGFANSTSSAYSYILELLDVSGFNMKAVEADMPHLELKEDDDDLKEDS